MVGDPDPQRLAIFATATGIVAALCAWQAELADRRRRELALVSRADPLTGCLNRRGFEERLAAELDEGLRAGRPLAIVMFDLDGFKEINDTQGHAAGDELLCWTVKTIEETVRPMDSVGRLGGDEFVVLLPASGHAGALTVAGRIREALAPRVGAEPGRRRLPDPRPRGRDAAGPRRRGALRGQGGTRAPAPPPTAASSAGRPPSPAPSSCASTRRWPTTSRAATRATPRPSASSWAGRAPSWACCAWPRCSMTWARCRCPTTCSARSTTSTPSEHVEVQKHPIVGAQLVERVEGLEAIAPWIRHSHEHFDGSGYPDGLEGEAIPAASRILRVVDAFDALIGRQELSESDALTELRGEAGKRFDPECVEALERHLTAAAAATQR